MRNAFLFVTFVFLSTTSFGQNGKKVGKQSSQPKLVVGLVIDQMRWDYLYRFQKRYGPGGFNRLVQQGHSFENTFIPYLPSYTAVGHTTVYTGSVPAIDGIVGNNWWEKSIQKNMYCTSDSTVQSVGGSNYAGQMSPRNLLVTTIGDELRLSTNMRSKVVGIALKDRGAILPAGHSANGAYWFDDKVGKFISSTFYAAALPQWVQDFNAKDEPTKMMSKDWNTLYPINTYVQSTTDDKPYEGGISGLSGTSFPYKTSTLTTQKFGAFKTTPYAATYTFDFAEAAVKGEFLGSGENTDMLTVSISSTDYAGHSFGPNSIEVEDTYLRLDKDISNFLSFLDKTYGMGNYLFFLSADHGAAHVPAFLAENKIPAGVFSDYNLEKEIKDAVKKEFDLDNVIENMQNYQVYVRDGITNRDKVIKFIIDLLESKPYITQAFSSFDINAQTIPEIIKSKLINGFNVKRSGDIQFLLMPGYFDGGSKGTTHGLWNPYDTHIPLLFYGWGVKKGFTNRETYMTDIAPTICAMLRIQMPNGSVGKVLEEVLDNK